ncbi:MAG: glycosyltransferase family 4 protein [Terracidiphilus sp.]|jgi:glycosyltransferase involved in cell wall biosynthesis
MKRRRILLVDLGTCFGGVETYLKDVVRFLQGEAEIFVLCLNPELIESLRETDARVLSIRFATLWGKPATILLSIAMLPYLRVFCGIDTVWINGYLEAALLPLARLLGCRAIATRHLTMDIEAGKATELWKRRFACFLYRILVHSANRVICVSKAVAMDLSVSSRKLVVIPNWVHSLPKLSSERSSKGKPLRLLFVGRLENHKGASLILEAMHELNNHSLCLTIVGEGKCRADLERQATGLDVTFAGFQRDTSIAYRAADLFINPTRGPEGLPLVSLEAMSYGLPCILSDLQVHKEITSNGACASLFRSGDSHDLCAKIQMFLSSPQLLADLGRLGRDMVATRHSAAAAKERYVEELSL